jgi:penicillin-binding protein 1A
MYDQGYITKEQMDDAKNEVVVFSKTKDTGPNFAKSAHFVSYIQQQLADRYGQKTLEEGGLSVVTTLDWNMQEAQTKR